MLSAAISCGLIEAMVGGLDGKTGKPKLSAAISCGLIEAFPPVAIRAADNLVIRSYKLRPH